MKKKFILSKCKNIHPAVVLFFRLVHSNAALPGVKKKVFFRKTKFCFKRFNTFIISGKGYEKAIKIFFYAVKLIERYLKRRKCRIFHDY